MSDAARAQTTALRPLRRDDLDDVVRIDALHTGDAKPAYWTRIFDTFLGSSGRERTFGFGIEGAHGLAGYLFGEIRAVEFGSETCGWVFAIGIEREGTRKGHASALLDAARRRFAQEGVHKIRTMVRRNDVPVLSFFRARGFVGGPYVQLELNGEEQS